MSCFQELSIVGLNDLFLQVTEQNYNAHASFQKIDFSLRKTEITIAGVSIFLTIGTLILAVVFILGNLPSKDKPLCTKLTSLSSQFYRSLLLPVCLWFLLPVTLALLTTSTKISS